MDAKFLYDELDEKWDERGYCKETDSDLETEFNILFDDKNQNRKYVVRGTIELWTGTYNHSNNRVYTSLKDAIIDSQYGFGICYTRVFEGEHGKLFFETIHHDGTNQQEILELSDIGVKLHDKGWSAGRLVSRKDATRNVRLVKRIKESHMKTETACTSCEVNNH